MDYAGWLDRVAVIEQAHPDKRVVEVAIPGGLPKSAWNVENRLYRGRIPLDGDKIPDMREGVYGAFRVTDGAFCVRFNDGTQI